MKSKSISHLIALGIMPLSLLLIGPLMAASSTSTPDAKAPSEEQISINKEDKDAFEQASGMKRDQPTGPDPTPGEMKQQQPHNSNIEQEVKEAKEKEIKNEAEAEKTPKNKEEVEKQLKEEGIPPPTTSSQ